MELKIKVVTLIALIGALIAFIGVFMDWVSILGFTGGSGWEMITEDMDGANAKIFAIISFVLIIVALLLAILDIVDVKLADVKIMQIVTIVVGLLIAVMVFLAVNDIMSLMKDMGAPDDALSYGIGFFLSLIGGVVVALAGILGITGVVKE